MASKRNAPAISEGRVKLHQAAGGALPFDDGTFDKACTVATVYVIADPSAVFREMHRVLKPNGLAAVTFPVREKFMRFKPAGRRDSTCTSLPISKRHSAMRASSRPGPNATIPCGSGAHCMLGRKPATTKVGFQWKPSIRRRSTSIRESA
jgi:SAM-dependent methyltransferase